MKIAIIGAGFAGLSSARVLTALGHDVTVYEKAPDVGGVWSATRRYPGLHTQNNKGSYALSELLMPKRYPESPSGQQVQQYLEAYVRKFDLASYLRLGTEVVRAEPAADGGWDVATAEDADGSEHYEHLVLASGIFSLPLVPSFQGIDALQAAGGDLLPASEFHSLDQVRGKHVVVVGYGKSACDIAVEIAKEAASTTVVARQLIWKMPRKIKGVVNYKYLMLTRMGEGLFKYHTVSGVEKVLHARNSALADTMLGSVGTVTAGQLGLDRLGLRPGGTFKDIARSTVSLATEGFFEGVASGRIVVHRDAEISRFVEKDGHPCAELVNGKLVNGKLVNGELVNGERVDGDLVRADVVIAATGWTQELPFLPDEVVERLVDERGDFLLHRQIHPIYVDDLSFAGYNSSFFSPLSCEVAAMWIGSLLGDNHVLPTKEEMHARVHARLSWMRERTDCHHARGTNIIPFSLHNIDEVLGDMSLDVGRGTKMKQWILPLNPSDYQTVLPKLRQRLRVSG
ncbi:MAG: NAD(P)/FAD-dependent oxidoreductase [Terracoccus sp.]